MKSSSRNPVELRRARPLLGTLVEMAVPDTPVGAAALERAFAIIATVQARMSAHDPASDLGALHTARHGAPVRVHPWTWRVLSAAKRLHVVSHGAFDPIAAGRLALASERLPRWRVPRPSLHATWRDVVLLPRSCVVLRKPLRFDLGGIAKGFAVDRAVEALRRAGVAWGLVNAGGDMRAFGRRVWPVHARHPAAPGVLVPLGTLREGALATSAPYFSEERREGRNTSALFDPASGRSMVGATSVSVFARTCLVADALTKAVLVDPETRALSRCRARAVIMTTSDSLAHAA